MSMKFFLSTLFLLVSYCAGATGQSPVGTTNSPQTITPESRTIKEKFRLVAVDRFSIKQGLKFPPEYMKNLQKEITKYLTEAKLFQQVLDSGQQSPTPSAPLLRLAGTIHNYKQGSRTERYIGAGLAGTSEIDARVVLMDDATGQKLVSKELRGALVGGVFGGNEDKTTQELAKQIVLEAKLMIERRLPPPVEAGMRSPGDPVAENPAEAAVGSTLVVDSKDLNASQKRLDEKAVAGFRVADFALTGKDTVDLRLEKSESSSVIYQYRLLYTRLFTHLAGEIDNTAAEGFSVVPGTLNFLGPYLAVIMEKTQGASQAPYAYRVTVPVRMANARKDAEKFQAQGYTLLDAVDMPSLHVLIFQKPTGN
jgi:hypothetical protein